jgi:hypothetical protein
MLAMLVDCDIDNTNAIGTSVSLSMTVLWLLLLLLLLCTFTVVFKMLSALWPVVVVVVPLSHQEAIWR